MTKELKPCPFCGVIENESYEEHSEGCYIRKLCDLVYDEGSTSEATHGEEAMRNAYNTRYKRTCESSYCKETNEWQCHECGGTLQACAMFDPDVDGFVSSPKFCPNCGAEVVDGD